MAEVAAAVGLVASIASLIELSAKVVSRLHEFTSKTSEIPESFRSLSIQLPLLNATLDRIQTQAQVPHCFSDDIAKALKDVVDSTLTQAIVVKTCLSDVCPPDGASKLERAVKALKSPAKEGKVQQALEKIQKNTDILVLYQTTRHVDIGDRILEELSKLHVTTPASSKSFGVCLGQAPQIAPDAFIGRKNDLQQLQDWLLSGSHLNQQCIVSIVGMGGMGKTQLSLAHVRECANKYSSVFWVNARDETSLRQSMADLSAVIFHESAAPAAQSVDEEKVNMVRRWLSEPGNDRWLLIFDNYDDPNLPGIRSATGYDLRSFFPTRSQGSIIITSRSTKLAFSKQLKLQKLENDITGVAILSQRSGRDLSCDTSALNLARRLDGLPLALATAGTYLKQSDISCDEYLELYNSAWMALFGEDAEELFEYEARTMSSTWTISLDQVRSQDKDAAELLTFLAYFGNRDIWYDLIKAGAHDDLPWMRRVTKTKIDFRRAMSKLHDYNLVNVVAGSYQVHPCLHDWLVESLNTPPKSLLFITALGCVAYSIDDKLSPQFWMTSRRLLEHIEQLESSPYHDLWQLHTSDERVIYAARSIAGLEQFWDRHKEAEEMLMRTLIGHEKVLGPNHTSTLDTVNGLGILYTDQGKLDAAEQMYMRALAGKEKAFGPDHISSLDTVNNLGYLYYKQDKLDAAEQMYLRALAGREKALGPDHAMTLETVHYLGIVYRDQQKPDAAEQMYVRALAGKEKALGPEHTSTLKTVNNLGVLYSDKGKLDAAEQMYMRALIGQEKSLGPNHTSTLYTVHNLGDLYRNQGKLDAAEKMYTRALAGREKVLGPDHNSTSDTLNNFALLCSDKGDLDAAERMYMRALAGKEKSLGPNHSSTLRTVQNLGTLYRNKGKLEAAEQMYIPALARCEKVLGPDHILTLGMVNNLGNLYCDQGKLDAAQRMYVRALAGFDKALGPDHTRTIDMSYNLGRLYRAQGKLTEAEQMYAQALAGYEKKLGPDHSETLITAHTLGLLYRDQGKLDMAEKMFKRAQK